MAVAAFAVASGTYESEAATSFATASQSLNADELYLLGVMSEPSGGSPSLLTSAVTATSSGVTWVQVATVTFGTNSSPVRRLTLLRTMSGSSQSGAITITGSQINQHTWSLVRWTGIDTSGSNGAGAVRQSVTNNSGDSTAASLTVTLASFGGSGNGAYGLFGNAPNNKTMSPDSGWTELYDFATGATYSRQEVQYRTSNDTSVVGAITDVSSQYLGGIAVEIQIAASPMTLTATMDSVVQAERTDTATLNSVVQGSVSLTATMNAVVESIVTLTTSFDAVVRGEKLVQVGLNAVVATEPTVVFVSPVEGGAIYRFTPIVFRVSNLEGLKRVLVRVAIEGEPIWDLVHDGDEFGPNYRGVSNTRDVIDYGFEFSILRDGGWLGRPIVTLFSLDSVGGEA